MKKIQKILFLDGHHPFELEPSNTEASEFRFAYPYKMITVRYSSQLIEDWNKKKYELVKSVLIHEMCHAITDPFYSKAVERYAGKNEIEEERERLTDTIANIIAKHIPI